MKCPTCKTGNVRTERVNRAYSPTLPDVLADGLEVSVCGSCGATFWGYPRPVELDHLVIGIIIGKPAPLAPNEIRFLRGALGMKATDLGAVLGGIGHEQISRFENGKRPMPATADRLLRMMVAVKYKVATPNLNAIDDDAEAVPVRLQVKLGEQGWQGNVVGLERVPNATKREAPKGQPDASVVGAEKMTKRSTKSGKLKVAKPVDLSPVKTYPMKAAAKGKARSSA